jgi:alpha-beta hydrolase superfamily lysophospholipase
VGLPDFPGHIAEPPLFDHYVKDTQKAMQSAGFNGTDYYGAAHSEGGAMLGLYSQSNPKFFKG